MFAVWDSPESLPQCDPKYLRKGFSLAYICRFRPTQSSLLPSSQQMFRAENKEMLLRFARPALIMYHFSCDYMRLSRTRKEASGVYFIGFLKGKVPQILRTRLAPNENIKTPFGRRASLRKASSKGHLPTNDISAHLKISGALFSPYDGCWGPSRGECSKEEKT